MWLRLVACLFFGLAGAELYLRATFRKKEIRSLLESVIAADSTASTGALINVLCVDDYQVTRDARRQLTRLASRWTEEDVAALTPDQREGIRRTLDTIQTARHGDASGAADHLTLRSGRISA